MYTIDNIRWGVVILHVLLGIPGIFILRWEAKSHLNGDKGEYYYGWDRKFALIVTFCAICLGPWMSVPVALVEFCRYLGRKGFWRSISRWFSRPGP